MPLTDIHPFQISATEAETSHLFQQLQTTYHPESDIVLDAGEDYGIPTSWTLRLLHYWRTNFSWVDAQRKINSTFSQYTTEIEGLTIHFIHQRSSTPDAIPILLIHGWPGSFHEFSEIILPLCEPADFPTGSPQHQQLEQAFHCVAPSLPGFCFSSPPPRKNWTVKDTARVFHTLMARLCYDRYIVQAGDWGQFVARELGANPAYSPDSCRAVHLNWCPGALPTELTDAELTERERGVRDRGMNWRSEHIGYAVQMRTRPQTLGWMLRDNPIGLLAFIGEKYHEASSPYVHEHPRWWDHILTTVCLYYFTKCIATSALIYYENVPHHEFADYCIRDENWIRCPMGYTSYWYDTAPNSRKAVERTGKLTLYRERDYAGHFAALEDPRGLCEDMRDLVRQVVGSL